MILQKSYDAHPGSSEHDSKKREHFSAPICFPSYSGQICPGVNLFGSYEDPILL